MAELELGPEPEPEPGAPALDLVSCSPGQQLEVHRESEGGEVAREESTGTSLENFNWESERWRGIRKKKMERERERGKSREKGVRRGGVEVWKEDSGKAIRFRGERKQHQDQTD